MMRPFLLFAVAALVLGCGSHGTDEPLAELQTASNETPRSVEVPKEEGLRELIDRTLDFTQHGREMSLEDHAAWQLLHGVLAFGENFEILSAGQKVNAVDWVFDGKPMKGWTINATPQGLRAEIEAGKYGQGHDDQWMAILSQWNVPATRPIIVAGKEYSVQDLIDRTKYDCFEGKESSWTIIVLSKHLDPMDQTWIGTDKQEWSLERLVAMEAGAQYDEETAQNEIANSACGGMHRLIGLSIALNNYKAAHPGVELKGGWLAAQQRIDWAVAAARELQLPTGAFSIAFLFRSANSNNLDEHLAATGHTLEFLTFALSKKQLEEPWVQKAVVYMCNLLERTKHLDLECGGLYHAVHALVLYREKVYGPREGEPRPQGAGELAGATASAAN
ncbi:ADP-ribosylation factor-directed GTPase activating protein isoform b [Lacipirellula sp.]|uniref:ADP-ribosylation factor-directed GTPase activating protein isoform b n=1 Tax=Lacipirellula sp. TaxID=2691419 RepID=UPI003D09DB98